MESTQEACKGDGCKCQIGDGDYCSDRCKASSDYGHCHCGHSACPPAADDAKEAAHDATRGDDTIV